jgi:hypothetical protein
MGRIYSSEPSKLKRAKLTQPVLLAIGRLVRAMAEIEDMVDLFICNLADLSETKTTILLGRTAVTRRLEIAEALAATRNDAALAIYKAAFTDYYFDLVDCRNAVAHGTLLGKNQRGELCFLTSNQSKPHGETARRLVLSYRPEHIIAHAKAAEEELPQFEQLLQVEALRAERLQRPLAPHPKGQKQGRAEQKRQPQSSPP